MSCAPVNFLNAFVPGWIAPVVKRLVDNESVAKFIRRLTSFPAVSKYASFVSIGTLSSQESIFKKLSDYYPVGTRFVVLTLNMDYMGAGPTKLGYIGQLDQVVQIRKRFPSTCLPFLCIDPRMSVDYDLVDFLKKYLDKGFIGIKLYPALGYYPFDPRLYKVYEYAQEHNIPIMTHCTRGGTYYCGSISLDMTSPSTFSKNPNPNKLERRNLPYSTKKISNEVFCDNFLDPDNYFDVLEEFPKLKICFAHYGGDDEMLLERSNDPQKLSWTETIHQLIEKYSNVYTDISYSLHEKKTFSLIDKSLNDLKYREKILFGTDFYMTERAKKEKMLATELAEYFTKSRTKKDSFKQISYVNPLKYLNSTYYKVPIDFNEL